MLYHKVQALKFFMLYIIVNYSSDYSYYKKDAGAHNNTSPCVCHYKITYSDYFLEQI